MTYIRVRLASFLGSKVSRLRSKTAEKENLLWAESDDIAGLRI